MENRKTESVTFRITKQDRENLEKVSSVFGQTKSDFLRVFAMRIVNQIACIKNE